MACRRCIRFEPDDASASYAGVYNVLWQIEEPACAGCRICIRATGSPNAARWPTKPFTDRWSDGSHGRWMEMRAADYAATETAPDAP